MINHQIVITGKNEADCIEQMRAYLAKWDEDKAYNVQPAIWEPWDWEQIGDWCCGLAERKDKTIEALEYCLDQTLPVTIKALEMSLGIQHTGATNTYEWIKKATGFDQSKMRRQLDALKG